MKEKREKNVYLRSTNSCVSPCWTAFFTSSHLILRAQRWSHHSHSHFIHERTGSGTFHDLLEITPTWFKHPCMTFSGPLWTFSSVCIFCCKNWISQCSLCGPGRSWMVSPGASRPQTLPRSCFGPSTSPSHSQAHCEECSITAAHAESRVGSFWLSQGFWSPGFPHCKIWPAAAAGLSDIRVLCFGSLGKGLRTVSGTTSGLPKCELLLLFPTPTPTLGCSPSA